MRIGAIGIDTSHGPEFARRIATLHAEGSTPCRVTHFWDPAAAGGEEAAERTRRERSIASWRDQVRGLGAGEVESLDELLGGVEGVMVLNLDGHRHFGMAEAAVARGLPVFVDKPLTCSLAEAKNLLDHVRRVRGRCFSASGLRFAKELDAIPRGSLGRLEELDAQGPDESLTVMPGLWYYGCHTIEMVDAIWGPGVARVRAADQGEHCVLDLEYGDGRSARLRLERRGTGAFAAAIRGERGEHRMVVAFEHVYARLVAGIVRFFEGGAAPVDLRDTVENIAVIEAANASAREDGRWVPVEGIR